MKNRYKDDWIKLSECLQYHLCMLHFTSCWVLLVVAYIYSVPVGRHGESCIASCIYFAASILLLNTQLNKINEK